MGAVAGLPFFPPVLFAAFRIDIGAAFFLLVVVMWGGYRRPKTTTDIAGVLVTGILTLGGNNGLVFLGQQYIYDRSQVVTTISTRLSIESSSDCRFRDTLVESLVNDRITNIELVLKPQSPTEVGVGILLLRVI